jgi:hypothetical protein
MSKDYDQDFIRVSCHALSASVHQEALGWVRALSDTMRDVDNAACVQLKDKINKCAGIPVNGRVLIGVDGLAESQERRVYQFVGSNPTLTASADYVVSL